VSKERGKIAGAAGEKKEKERTSLAAKERSFAIKPKQRKPYSSPRRARPGPQKGGTQLRESNYQRKKISFSDVRGREKNSLNVPARLGEKQEEGHP